MSTQILMPARSPTMEEGKLARWLVKEGDEVHSGDILAEIETDKATMEFEAVDEGRIGKLLVPEGTEGVKVNQPIATLLAEGESANAKVDITSAMQSIKDAIGGAPPNPAAPPTPAKPVEAKPAAAAAAPVQPKPAAAPASTQRPSSPSGRERVFASPLARRVASQR